MRADLVKIAPILLLLILFQLVPAQDAPKTTPPQAETPTYQDTFSGSVEQIAEAKLTVTRSTLGEPPEKRSFLIKPDTKVEGKLKVKARVTVGFDATDEGDVARLIVVRGAAQKK